jgi:threonine dehydratase
MVEFRDIQNATENIKNFIHKTPLMYSNSFSKMTGAEVFLKAENLQKTGSFKVRGAFNKMINASESVIAASMGNHAQAVAFAAGSLGIKAKIVMPVTAPIVKEEATKGYGAEVVSYGESFQESLDYALSQKDYMFIHAFDDEKVIAGQGTIGIEIMDDLKDIDVILVPVGGGGLISGISIAVKTLSTKTRIIGVQAESATSAYSSLKEKKISEKVPLPTIADGIAIGRVGERIFEIISKNVDDILLVDEDSIALSILLYLERKKIVVEGAGAVTLAALLKNRERFAGKRIVLVVSGGNIDFTLIDRIIQKGLVSSGRVGIFDATLDDIPGSLHALTGIISSHRGNLLNVFHDRLAGNLPIGKTRVVFVIEVRNRGHLEEILMHLGTRGFEVRKRTDVI